jgi:uncharacterized phage-associated protein
MPYPPSIIAYDFVNRGIVENNPVTQMKLHKLIFFAHGLYLASLDDPLIDENFEAWKFGPVVPSVYHEYKLYGSSQILNFDFTPYKYLDKPDLAQIDDQSKNVIDVAWKTLNKFDGVQLSNWTHNPDSAWSKHYKPGLQSVPIPDADIKAYFKRFIKE